MTNTLVRLFGVSAILSLAACGNSPQQPTSTVDDRSIYSPYYDGEETGDEARTDVAGDEDGNEPAFDVPETDPVQTGAVVAGSSVFQHMSGSWAESAADCLLEPAVTISASRIEQPGRICEVAELIAAGDGSVTAALLCPTTAQESNRELLRLSLEDDGLTVSIVGSTDPPATLERCEP